MVKNTNTLSPKLVPKAGINSNKYCKITGKGLNVRHFVSNIEFNKHVRSDFYVKRGETSENRIKEVMCFSDRLSNHGFWANFFRLFLSSLAYEMFLLLKAKIKKTTHL